MTFDKPKQPKPKRGQSCVVYTRAYDQWLAGWRVMRIVKVNRAGVITHVTPDHRWRDTIKANKGNDFSANFIVTDPNGRMVLTIGSYVDFDLSDLDGEIYRTTEEIAKAISGE